MTGSTSPLAFRHLAPELRLYSGKSSLASLIDELKRNGCKRAVIVCGRSVVGSQAMDLARAQLGPLLVGECTSVQPNSPIAAVEETARILSALAADAVVAIGGGSAAVTTRAALILLAEKRPLRELCTRRLPDGKFDSPRVNSAKLPHFVVATTPSTAFVKIGSAIHDADGTRMALFDPKTRVKAVFLDSEFLRTSPHALQQSASLNTLSTAIEGLGSSTCDPIAEAMLTQAVRLVARHLRSECLDDACRQYLAVAGILCGRGTNHAGGGLASALAHAIGYRTNAANGLVNAILLPHTTRFNAPNAGERFPCIAESLGVYCLPEELIQTASEQAVVAIERLLAKLAIPRRLRDIGVAREDFAAIADAVMSDWFISRNPRPVSKAGDVLSVLEGAW